MIKAITVIGTRPQYIKASVVSPFLKGSGIDEVIIDTGQHYSRNLSDIFIDDLKISKIKYNLEIGSFTHGKQTGQMLEGIEKILIQEKPDCTIVYGDTNSTLAGALAAVKLHIPAIHVEAGLRCFNRKLPEEVNRVIIDHISHLLFTPTLTANENLGKEGITKNVFFTGDVMYDLALIVRKNLDIESILGKFKLENRKFVLVTFHRQENTDEPEALKRIWRALMQLAEKGIKIFFPIHPRALKALESHQLIKEKIPANLMMVDPISYRDMAALEAAAGCIITDSGGVQKEAYFHGTRCIVLRQETSWVELIDNNWNILAGTDTDKIINKTINLLNSPAKKEKSSIFGDGNAGKKIAELIRNNI